ncbi:MAG: lincosamide nucleotidyltransferase [Frankiaceae bacterium]|jgi:lincosamide nucleotidyltransferase A/C/D/E|nr:lincosamide nucleotidyltransferase [Frankiaceae bacterium]
MSARVRLLRAVGRLVAATPARRLLATDLARRIRLRAGRQVDATTARAVVDALEAADLPYRLIGGWGVDALLGRQTRPHVDLDIVVDDSAPDLLVRIDVALATVGLHPVGEETSIPPMPTVWVYADDGGATVDVLPANLSAPPFDGGAVTGKVDGRPVACISAEIQRELRAGYRHRRTDRDDLSALADLPTP